MHLTSNNINELTENAINIASEAGNIIKNIYLNNNNLDIKIKNDNSPVTKADLEASNFIINKLSNITKNIPVLSEESESVSYQTRCNWDTFWIIDPLDGTKEFIARNDEFTVNIALIQKNSPVLGVIYSPILDVFYYANIHSDSYKKTKNIISKITTKKLDQKNITIAISRRHSNNTQIEKIFNLLGKDNINIIHKGSSLKMCAVAEGNCDLYPRIGPTSEWDTAAGQVIVTQAGGAMTTLNGNPLKYNKKSLINPDFLTIGDPLAKINNSLFSLF